MVLAAATCIKKDGSRCAMPAVNDSGQCRAHSRDDLCVQVCRNGAPCWGVRFPGYDTCRTHTPGLPRKMRSVREPLERTNHKRTPTEERFCKDGCGQRLSDGNSSGYALGHRASGQQTLCGCGCGCGQPRKQGLYLRGHNPRHRPPPPAVIDWYGPKDHRDLRMKVLRRDNFRCIYCGGAASEPDHVVPRSYGGPNLMGNLVASCRQCNVKKTNKPSMFTMVRGLMYLLEKGEDLGWTRRFLRKDPVNLWAWKDEVAHP